MNLTNKGRCHARGSNIDKRRNTDLQKSSLPLPHLHPIPNNSTSDTHLCFFLLLHSISLPFYLLLPQLSIPALTSFSRMSTDPLDISSPLVDGLSYISLIAPTADLFYSTVQFYESLGFQAVALV